MTTVTITKKVLDLMKRIDTRLERIETEVKEIRDEIGLEVRPEYLKRLGAIDKEKARPFEDKDDFLDYVQDEI